MKTGFENSGIASDGLFSLTEFVHSNKYPVATLQPAEIVAETDFEAAFILPVWWQEKRIVEQINKITERIFVILNHH